MFLAAAKTICFEDPPCFSPARHWLQACAFSWWNGNLHLALADKLQGWVSPPVCTGSTFPFVIASAIWAFLPIGSDCCRGLLFRLFVSASAIWAFCQLVLTCVWCWRSFMSTDCYMCIFANWFWCLSAIGDRLWAWSAIWVFLPIGSDTWHLTTVEDHLWAPSVIWVFCQLVLTSNYHWGLFVLGKYLFGTVPVTLGEGLWQIYHLVCERVFHMHDWYSCCLM